MTSRQPLYRRAMQIAKSLSIWGLKLPRVVRAKTLLIRLSVNHDETMVAVSVDQDRQHLAIDLAQVKADGQAVFAGQAVPGAIIVLR